MRANCLTVRGRWSSSGSSAGGVSGMSLIKPSVLCDAKSYSTGNNSNEVGDEWDVCEDILLVCWIWVNTSVARLVNKKIPRSSRDDWR